MGVKIYSTPKEVELPKTTFQNVSEWEKLEKQYIQDLKKYIMSIGYKGKNVGEIIKFPVADGYAQYMVLSMRPLQLIHLELGDAWHFPQAHLMTTKEVNKKIDSEKSLAKLFGGN